MSTEITNVDPIVPSAESTSEGDAAPPVVEPSEVDSAKRSAELTELAKATRARWRARQEAQDISKQARDRIAAAEARAERAEAIERRSREDPLGFLEERGATSEQLIQRAIRKGTPEEQIVLLQQRLDAADKRAEEQQRQARIAYQEQTKKAAESEFQSLAKDEKSYPSLNTLYTPQEIVKLGWELLQNAANDNRTRGHEYTDSEILAALEKRAATTVKKAIERHQGKAVSNDNGNVESKDIEQGDGRQGTSKAAPTTRTLTNGNAAQRSSAPTDFDRLPEREQNRILAEQLRQATRG